MNNFFSYRIGYQNDEEDLKPLYKYSGKTDRLILKQKYGRLRNESTVELQTYSYGKTQGNIF